MAVKYDIIGDIHGCYDELVLLLRTLGYRTKDDENPCKSPLKHPDGRVAVSVGDLCDRGPDSPSVIALWRQMVREGTGLVAKGNHDDKLERYLKGNKVKVGHGLDLTISQMHSKSSPIKKKRIYQFLVDLPYRLELDEGKLLVCHAGLAEKYHNASMNKKIKAKCIYGETTGAKDENGFPVRLPWQDDYEGSTVVVHGHVAVEEVLKVNNVWDIDTSCVFGGSLTALRYPEMETVSQPALKVYAPRNSKNPLQSGV
jgi:diadenosine tetraphosphatase ApaH/serine/threonine PP2A family protein phosphatase